ncbi:hypothetical protein [Carnobacterium divergens]|uniref:hypothetical protein n=1 Tax=Carnobacterium divergens TaxID=2748 RepID=UPI00265CBA57|nr:hypothetical protein [Carnobacterium divergens]
MTCVTELDYRKNSNKVFAINYIENNDINNIVVGDECLVAKVNNQTKVYTIPKNQQSIIRIIDHLHKLDV